MAVRSRLSGGGRAPAHLTSMKQAAMSRSYARKPARPRALPGDGSRGQGILQRQELLWRLFFRDPLLWWDNRQDKKSDRSPDFRHRESHEVLWLNSVHKPPWVDAQLAAMERRAADSDLSLSDESDYARPAGYESGVTGEIVSRLCDEGRVNEAVDALGVLVRREVCVSKSLFYYVLKLCDVKKDLALGRRVHAFTVKQGYESDTFLCNHILRMYASRGRLHDAMDVFSLIAEPDAFMWSSIISAHVKLGKDKEAIKLYNRMQRSSAKPDGHVFVAALQACARGSDLKTGQQVHADVLASGDEPHLIVCNGLVDMYAKCGRLEDGKRVFDGLRQKDVVTWNTMIAGYAQQGMGQEALRLYSDMQDDGVISPNSVTFVCLLQACASVGTLALDKGKQLHVEIGEQGHQVDVYVANSLVNMYAKCGSLEDAQRVFEGLSQKDVVAWTALIAGYSQQGMPQEALRLYSVMQVEGMTVPDPVTFVCLLQACASVGTPALEEGKQLHVQIKERGHQAHVQVANSLVNMYAKCGSLEDAHSVFDGLHQKDVVTWTVLIAGYSQRGRGQEALRVYSAMLEEGIAVPNFVTFGCLLQACASVGSPALAMGIQLHEQIRERADQAGSFVATSLVNMYAKCGSLEDAQIVFTQLREKDVVTWNAMIAAYTQQGMGQEAFQLHHAMQEEGIVVPNSVTFVYLLQACASVGTRALEKGKQLHAQVREQGLQPDGFIGNSLVNMYAKCGSLEDAQRLFDGLEHKDVVTWTALIGGYSQHGMFHDALHLYDAMQDEGTALPNAVTFVCLLQACASVGTMALEKGKQLHRQLNDQAHQVDGFVASSLVNMYVKCGSIEDAQRVFDGLGQKDVVTWNSLIAGYSQKGMGEEALRVYSDMQEVGIAEPNSVTFVCLLQACAVVGTSALEKGMELRMQIEEQGIQADVFVANSLVNMYAKCGSLEDAQRVFDDLGRKDVVTWNAMIAGYSQQGMGQEALRLYSAMQGEANTVPNSVTYSCLLQACASVGSSSLEKGRQLHVQIKEQGHQADLFVANSLIHMYAKCGGLEDAQTVFDELSQKDVVTWNAMIGAYSQQGMGLKALCLYSAMQEEGISVPDSVTFACLLQACASVGSPALESGKQFHAQIREGGHQADVFVASNLINMYAKCGSLGDARGVFDELGKKDLVMWNTMIAGYSQQGMCQEALSLYSAMQECPRTVADTVTFGCLLQACASMGTLGLDKGKQLHSQIKERGHEADAFVASSLVSMYAKCGSLDNAERVFDMLLEKNVVIWTAMIQGYSEQGMGQEALRLYSAMQDDGLSVPDAVTFVCLLQACASVAALHIGRQLHAQIEEQGLQADVFVASSLVNMYGKCGSMADAQQVFDSLPERSVFAWSALIGGYTCQGDDEVVFDLFHRMIEAGIQPDGITFLSVLKACSHVGVVDKGKSYFELMTRQYEITPMAEHYTCMVDLLGRAGQLDEALAWVERMHVPPNADIWHTLLGACRKWNNVQVGCRAFNEAVKLDKKDAAAYVLMWNIYTGARMWEQARETQTRRKRIRAWKQPGQSWWTDTDGLLHSFVAGDKEHRGDDERTSNQIRSDAFLVQNGEFESHQDFG